MIQEYSNPSLAPPETERPLPRFPPPPQYPQQGMVDRQSCATKDKFGELFPSWTEFLEERERRQAELIKLESPRERQVRESRERSRDVKQATVFTWEKIVTSGGQIVFARVAVPKSQNEDVLAGFTKNQQKYNAFANEWDVCEDFAPGEYLSDDDDMDSDGPGDFYGMKPVPRQPQHHQAEHPQSPADHPFDTYSPVHSPPRLRTPPERVVSTPPRHLRAESPAQSMEIEENSENIPPYSLDVVETIGRQYGYIAPLGAYVAPDSSLQWWKLLQAIGFVEDPENDISETEKAAIVSFISTLLSQEKPHHDLWDLDDFNYASLSGFSEISDVHRPAVDLYLFAKPSSGACRWILGVKSAAVALYVVRILMSNPTHNILTVTRVMMSRGVPFHTFLHMRDFNLGRPDLSSPFAPTAFRFVGFRFAVADFEAAMVQCRQILNQPQGRAALLMGGILWRIAKQYLSLDGALMGPSIEVTAHRTGYSIADKQHKRELWDDALTENEMRVICGSYKLLTGRGVQETVKSWFPPHEIWMSIQSSGQCWLEWTQVNERWFTAHFNSIQTGKFQPLTAHEWRKRLRMSSKAMVITKKIISHNETLSLKFLDAKQKS